MNTTDDDIRTLAYHLWEAAGRPHGRDVEFWEAARSQLLMGAVEFVDPFALSRENAAANPREAFDALIGHMITQQGLPPQEALQLTEHQAVELAPGWHLKLDRPGESLPPVRKFFGAGERSIDPEFNAQARVVGISNRPFQGISYADPKLSATDPGMPTPYITTECFNCADLTPTKWGVDWAAPGDKDRTVVATVAARSDGPATVEKVTLLEPGDPRPPHAVVMSPPEVAGRLARLEREVQSDEAKLKAALAKKREARRRGEAAAPPPAVIVPELHGEETPAVAEARTLVPPHLWPAFCKWFREGDTSDGELKEFVKNTQAGTRAATLVLNSMIAAFVDGAKEMRAEGRLDPPRPATNPLPQRGLFARIVRNTACRLGLHNRHHGPRCCWCGR